MPRKIVFIDKIPKGPTGKPQRIGLAEKLDLAITPTGGVDAAAGELPQTATERKL